MDTRAIVTYLREQGSTLAKITIGEEYDEEQDEAFVDPEQINLVRKVSTKQPFHVSSGTGDMHVALIDCGVKENILRSLVGRGCSVTCFPFDFPLEKVAHHFDGVFISNGPGDPTHCVETGKSSFLVSVQEPMLSSIVHTLRTLFQTSQLPVFGICLGHQLVALAAGARTVKLKYGNRAHNIPCTHPLGIKSSWLKTLLTSAQGLDLTTGRVNITSQNHGYAVDAQTLPSDFKEVRIYVITICPHVISIAKSAHIVFR